VALSKEEKKLISECIESHQRMIKHHRQQIIDLSRKLVEVEVEMESFNIEVKK